MTLRVTYDTSKSYGVPVYPGEHSRTYELYPGTHDIQRKIIELVLKAFGADYKIIDYRKERGRFGKIRYTLTWRTYSNKIPPREYPCYR